MGTLFIKSRFGSVLEQCDIALSSLHAQELPTAIESFASRLPAHAHGLKVAL